MLKYRDTVWACDRVRKAKNPFELNLLRDENGNGKCFYEYRNSKRKTGENADLLLSGAGDLVTKKREKAKILITSLSRPFTSKVSLLESQAPE